MMIGGGDGGLMEGVLKHRSIEKVRQVEIDAGVVDFARQYLASICRDAFDDPRLELVIADGVDFVSSCAERYDLVLVDSTDPIGAGEVLFSETFYGDRKSTRLNSSH